MSLSLLLLPSGGPRNVAAVISATTSLSASLTRVASNPVSATVVVVSAGAAQLSNGTKLAASVVINAATLSAQLSNGTKLAASVIINAATLSAQLSNGTKLAAAAIASNATLSAQLRNGTQLAASVIINAATLSAQLRNGTQLAASVIFPVVQVSALPTNVPSLLLFTTTTFVVSMSVRLPGREYGSPVSTSSGRTGSGGTPTPF